MNKFLMECATLKVLGGPVDFNDAAITGARIDMQGIRALAIVVIAAAGTAPTAHGVSFQQHNVSTGGTPIALPLDNPYFLQVGAETKFTRITPGADASTYDLHAAVAANKFIAVFEILAEDLTDGYRWVSANLTDAGGAQLGTILAIAHDGKQIPVYDNAV